MKLVQCIEGLSYTKGDGTTFVAPCTGIFVDITAKEEKTPNLFGNIDDAYASLLRMRRDWVSYTPAVAREYLSSSQDATPPTGVSITNDLQGIQNTINEVTYAVRYSAGAISSAESFVREPVTLPEGVTFNTEAMDTLRGMSFNNITIDEES